MKKLYIKRLLSVLLFLTIFLFLFLSVSEVVRRKINAGVDMIHSSYALEKNTLDVLCVGSSHAYYGTQPNILWEKHGLTSYVAAAPSSTMFANYFIIKEILKRQTPKVIALETYSASYKDLYSDDAVIRRICDSLRLSKNKLEMLSIVCKGMSLQERASYYLPIMKYHSRWDSLNDYDFHHKQAYLKGSRLTLDTRPFEPNVLKLDDYEAADPYENSMLYMEKIIELCEERGIPLLLYAVPVNEYDKKLFKRYSRLNLFLETYARERNIPFLLMERDEGIMIDPATDFKDSSHLNYFGQKKISEKLGDFIVENYGVIGHRGDPAYQSWEDEYIAFNTRLETLLKEAEDGSNIKATDSEGAEEE